MLNTFISKVKETILSNIQNEKFGVSELASELNISRSQLLRKIKSATGKSANQLIREIRLEKAAKMLLDTDITASEISFKTGFSSPSYFNKCFLDYYNLTPGEFKNSKGNTKIISSKTTFSVFKKYKKLQLLLFSILVIVILAFGLKLITKDKNSKSSIAVLPLLDLSENKDKDYLVDGLTEAITLELAKNESIRVISRGSAMKFKGKTNLYSQIANELDVDLLLEGSILHHGDSLRVVVQLIQPFPKEKHIWQSSYNRSPSDIFGLVHNVSNEIANEISAAVIPQETNYNYNPNPKAYDLYLKGRHLWNFQKSQEFSLLKALDYLNEAIKIDPKFASPYVVIAETYLAMNSLVLDNEEKIKYRNRASIAVEEALKLDSLNAEAYVTKGNVVGKFGWQWNEMKILAEKALNLDPNNANARALLSNYYLIKGNYERAIEEAKIANKLDPINPYIGCLVAERYYINHEYQKSITIYKKVIELNPNYGLAFNGLGFAYYQSGNKDKAIESWQKMQYIVGNNALGECYDKNSYEDCFRFYLKNAKSDTPRFCRNPLVIAQVHMMLNEEEEALESIKIAQHYKSADLGVMLAYPDFHKLKRLPQFQEILKGVGVKIID